MLANGLALSGMHVLTMIIVIYHIPTKTNDCSTQSPSLNHYKEIFEKTQYQVALPLLECEGTNMVQTRLYDIIM